MFAKIVKGKDLAALESEVNKYLTDNRYSEKQDPGINKEMLDEMINRDLIVTKRLRVYNVQQFVIGEVDPSTVALVSRQPVPTYLFCLLLICGYE
jgi:hypothetical protein